MLTPSISFYELFLGLLFSSPLTGCLNVVVNQPYTGTVNLTNHGFTCQAWTAQYPHKHSRTNDATFPDDGSVAGASNYCRNFGGTGRPYCYTLHRYIFWEFCDLQICGGKKRFEPRHEKTNVLHMPKQRRRSASR